MSPGSSLYLPILLVMGCVNLGTGSYFTLRTERVYLFLLMGFRNDNLFC